ncbi:unnamed protein product [Strongylus vulgaris]|uniref:Uncharacterized protein n=1 Tax=Strongylus vulgaris TaxID=40348 RepID=A0A3P7JBX8_STRVU|nr:unnamed protein product [Strongylus vulgaris]
MSQRTTGTFSVCGWVSTRREVRIDTWTKMVLPSFDTKMPRCGSKCSPILLTCEEGFECIENESRDDYLCCQIPPIKKEVVSLIKAINFSKLPKPRIPPTTVAPLFTTSDSRLRCGEDVLPMLLDGEYMRCPQLGAPCPKAGYTCQIGIGGLYCCPLDVELEEETTSTFPPKISKFLPETPCKGILEICTIFE